jgi:hypothetical protein
MSTAVPRRTRVEHGRRYRVRGLRPGDGRLSDHALAQLLNEDGTPAIESKTLRACRCRSSATSAPTTSASASPAWSRAPAASAPASPISIPPDSHGDRCSSEKLSTCSIPSAPAAARSPCVWATASAATARMAKTTRSSFPTLPLPAQDGGLVLSIGQFNAVGRRAGDVERRGADLAGNCR